MGYTKRKIFHYTHRSIGSSTQVFGMVAMFLGVLIPEVQLGRVGWGLCIGWTLWSIVLPLIIEILTESIEMFYIDKTYEIDDTDPNKEQIVTGYLETYRRKVIY